MQNIYEDFTDPIWNDGDEATFWVRMVLGKGRPVEFTIDVSVNCANANGVTRKVKIRADNQDVET